MNIFNQQGQKTDANSAAWWFRTGLWFVTAIGMGSAAAFAWMYASGTFSTNSDQGTDRLAEQRTEARSNLSSVSSRTLSLSGIKRSLRYGSTGERNRSLENLNRYPVDIQRNLLFSVLNSRGAAFDLRIARRLLSEPVVNETVRNRLIECMKETSDHDLRSVLGLVLAENNRPVPPEEIQTLLDCKLKHGRCLRAGLALAATGEGKNHSVSTAIGRAESLLTTGDTRVRYRAFRLLVDRLGPQEARSIAQSKKTTVKDKDIKDDLDRLAVLADRFDGRNEKN